MENSMCEGDENAYRSEGERANQSGGVPAAGCALAGCGFGCVAAMVLWFFPLPVIVAIWLFDLKGLFSDYMYMAVPFFALLPAGFGWIGWYWGRRICTGRLP
jgi:hypothetical protein